MRLQVRESPEMYRDVTLPHIESIPEAHIKWVHNILERKVRCRQTSASLRRWLRGRAHSVSADPRAVERLRCVGSWLQGWGIACMQAEADRLLFEDSDPETGFMLHPDLKWDQVSSFIKLD